jgi:adenine-specific DNA-methyltransferase
MSASLSRSEEQRHSVAGETARAHKSAMGQFMTPATIAQFMASLFAFRKGDARLLDPGAGLGALTTAVLDRWRVGAINDGGLSVTAYELDGRLHGHLSETFDLYVVDDLTVEIRQDDYLASAASAIEQNTKSSFTHAIINPPYKKISANSDARSQAQRAGLTVVNLYAAFVGLALVQLEPKGQLVAIIPRSFCNGPYYKSFRQWILTHSAIKQIHLFDSRTQAFKDDAVLQENVILLLERGGKQGSVLLSTSTDDTFSDHKETLVPFEAIVKPKDADLFFHVSHGKGNDRLNVPRISSKLADLNVSVSTGPVVTFRSRNNLIADQIPGSVPMLYAKHISAMRTVWPGEAGKKANAILDNDTTSRQLYPAGTYVIVRRMSSKEESKRVVAAVVTAADLGNAKHVGLDNGLNVFHCGKRPLDDAFAWGLVSFLSSTALDEHFRRFNGHTQVNATDLRNIPYPARLDLIALGDLAMATQDLSQSAIDQRMEALLNEP